MMGNIIIVPQMVFVDLSWERYYIQGLTIITGQGVQVSSFYKL